MRPPHCGLGTPLHPVAASFSDCLLCSLGRRHTPYGNQTDYRIFELNKRLQNWTEVGSWGSEGRPGMGGCSQVCVLEMGSSALPALTSCLGSRRNPLGSGVLPCCAGPRVPCASLGCGTGLIIPVSEHSAGSAALHGLSAWLLCLAASSCLSVCLPITWHLFTVPRNVTICGGTPSPRSSLRMTPC